MCYIYIFDIKRSNMVDKDSSMWALRLTRKQLPGSWVMNNMS